MAFWLGLLFSAGSLAQPLPICPKEAGKDRIYGARCGAISLPENPQDPASKTIEMYTLRIPAIRDSNKPPIFFITGGPGQASTDLAGRFRHQFKELLIDHDFVFVDQRGTGKSNPLECDIDYVPFLDKSIDLVEAAVFEEHKRCLENIDADLRRYTTTYAVQDLDSIRAHLGYEKIFLWGGSYGTRVVLEYLRQFPSSLAGAVLDGLAPVAISLPTHAARDASASLNNILLQCEASSACAEAFPDLRARWLTRLDQLAKNPLHVELQHPRSGRSHRVYIDDLTLSSWLRLILYARELAPLAPLMMHQSTMGNYATLFSIVSTNYDTVNDQISELMHTAVLCAEDRQWPNHSASKPDTQSGDSDRGLIRMPTRDGFEKMCTLYPATAVEADYFKTAQREVPALLLSGHFDPVTPASWAEMAYQPLRRAQHIVVPGGHHIVSGLACVAGIIEDFIAAPSTIGSLDTACVSSIRPADFFIDAAGPAMEANHD